MFYPDDVKYTKDHIWALIDGDSARIGITDYAQDMYGELLYIGLPEVGTRLCAGDVLAEIEASDTNTDIICPLSGEVVSVNDDLEDSPELINEDPYGAWIVEIEMSDPDESDDLIEADEYEELLEEEE